MKESKEKRTPFMAKVFLSILLNDEEYREFTGDVDEIYKSKSEQESKIRAILWYWSRIIESMPSILSDNFNRRIDMFKHYFKIAIRNFQRHKFYSFINISGLAIGIAVFIFIVSFVHNELSHDGFHENLDRIYQIGLDWHNGTPRPLAELLKSNFPEIEETARLRNNYQSNVFKYRDRVFKITDTYFADGSLFNVFSFKIIKGDPENPFRDLYSIILTEDESEKIFGEADPIGQIINYNNRWDLTVTAVVENPPASSFIFFNALLTSEFLESVPLESVNWGHSSSQTFLLLSQNTDDSDLQEKMKTRLTQMFSRDVPVALRPMKSLYFDIYRGGRFKHGNMANVYIFSAIAVIIIILACSNFINLSVARSTARAKEVGISKVVGSFRGNLIKQFLSESVILCLVAAVFASLIVFLFKQEFFNLIGGKIEIFLLNNIVYIFLLLAGTVLIGLISGFYPAFHLSAFKPVEVIQGQRTKGVKGALLRKILIGFQFTMSIILIFGTITVNRQLNYINSMDLGIDKNHVIWMDLNASFRTTFNTFKEKLQQNSNIKKMSISNFTKPGIESKWGGNINGQQQDFNIYIADANFVQTMGLEIINGRDFSEDMATDAGQSVLLNETAVKKFGFENPIGQTFNNFRIIGVVKDFYFQSLHFEIAPLVILNNLRQCSILNIKISSDNINETISFIEETWQEFSPNFPFEFHFFDESIEQLYLSEKKFKNIFLYFSAFAIFIACLGLFGLTSYITAQKTREIGIRKVVGASVYKIVLYLMKESILMVIISCIIAWPVSWYIMNRWLQNFAYRSGIGIIILFYSLVFALIIAVVSVSYQTIRAARANPVDSLRYE